uniref:Putative ovule protein n=1 Tax=Solanum chacoense TaxID=4108 RepID=A0A0V0HIK7_SOLCH
MDLPLLPHRLSIYTAVDELQLISSLPSKSSGATPKFSNSRKQEVTTTISFSWPISQKLADSVIENQVQCNQ